MLLSVVVPCFNEQEALPLFYKEICNVFSRLSCKSELIFVDDGSSDDTLKELKRLAKRDDRVNYVSFSRNFGKEAAMYAGMKNSSGDYVAIMDVDLQDPPGMLREMLDKLDSDTVDCVATRRVTRKGEPPIRSWFARKFYKLINRISEVDFMDGARDYRVMSRRMVDAVLELGEYPRFSKGLFQWVGFETVWMEYENEERVAGETKWSFWKLFKYAIDGIVAFSTTPLRIASVIGAFASCFSIIYLLYLFFRTVFTGSDVPGYPSLMVTLLLIGGLILLALGILGEYIARTYMQVKRRPLYVERENTKQNTKG